MRSPTLTPIVPSSFFSSAMSIIASPLPPTLTNATFAPMATMLPSTVWPRRIGLLFVFSDASNIAAKSSSGSVTGILSGGPKAAPALLQREGVDDVARSDRDELSAVHGVTDRRRVHVRACLKVPEMRAGHERVADQ